MQEKTERTGNTQSSVRVLSAKSKYTEKKNLMNLSTYGLMPTQRDLGQDYGDIEIS